MYKVSTEHTHLYCAFKFLMFYFSNSDGYTLLSTNCMKKGVTSISYFMERVVKIAVIVFTPLSKMYNIVLGLIVLLTAIIYQCALSIDNANLKEAIDRANSTLN